MSIQTDLTFTDIALHQAELRREASQSRLSRQAQARNHRGFLGRILHRTSRDSSSPTADH